MSCTEYSPLIRNTSSNPLEDEICSLRDQMVRIFEQGNPFTSNQVIEISCELDLKINEYMKSCYAYVGHSRST
ncbi:aspartyl-phosphate phosphatase Spo0E family protein [Paenibacillus sp. P96]|uniref:Aspartyl-phosphate phosphatase Spo0E family protein n=1 Tax=Paenibacillus zeirhizosphaerae TaxID=2987519 RepID=A0ABT9FLT5_9BACL|nr:aspartyl-phosphate phosphatase Spo0E family protein [Paenibacillus sp. P96]MDP4095501.1 aspartyl-phosphate phosphatase Spo0E family protein [Paenibacillus sp. P96]